MSYPLVSVIIPVYNAESYLGECIQSVLSQTWSNLEIIIINDGSSDKSLAIANSYKDSRIQIIDQPNRGASAARNKGIKKSTGSYIQFLDSDDILSPDKIYLQMQILSQYDNDHISSCSWGRFTSDYRNSFFKPDYLWQNLTPVDFLTYKYNHHSMMQPAVWLLPREIVIKSGQWDESLSLNDDGEYFSRIVLSCQKILFCEGAKVYYRSGNKSSLSQQTSSKHKASLKRSVELCADQLLQFCDDQKTRQAVVNLYQELIYFLFPMPRTQLKYYEQKIQQLGVTPTRPLPGGPLRRYLSKLLGWKLAARVHKYFYKIRQLKFSVNRFI